MIQFIYNSHKYFTDDDHSFNEPKPLNSQYPHPITE